MIRIAVTDDHPALRAGLRTVIDAEPGLVFVGESAGDEETVWPLLKRTDPDLLLLDYHLPDGDGLQLCHRIKHGVTPPKVLVYSAYASPALAVPAMLARADGLVDKGLAARELFEAIREVHRGDRPVVGMLLDGASESEIANALRIKPAQVEQATRRILAEMRVDVPVRTG